MADFKILQEQELDYGKQNQLWIMLIEHNGKFGIEIDSRTDLVGRKMAWHRKEAEAMFMRTCKHLTRDKDISTATALIQSAFTLHSVRETMFIISTKGLRLTFTDLPKLKHQYGFQTTPHYEDLLSIETEMYELKIYFPGNPVHIAKFVGYSLEDLHVELNCEQVNAE